MKRWVILTVCLYGAMLLTLTMPFLVAWGFDWFAWGHPPNPPEGETSTWTAHFTISWEESLELYGLWPYWLWLVVMLAAQACFLLVPLDISKDRPQPRRSLAVPVCTTAFLLGYLTLAGILSMAAALGGDPFAEWLFELAGDVERSFDSLQTIPPLSSILNATSWNTSEEEWFFILMTMTGVVFWMMWGLIFFNACKEDSDQSLLQRSVKWLLRGSILEFLVAVPCHVVVRHRHDCCAIFGTFWGLTMGLSVMLLAFGPGVFFLFAARAKRLRPRPAPDGPSTPKFTQ